MVAESDGESPSVLGVVDGGSVEEDVYKQGEMVKMRILPTLAVYKSSQDKGICLD